MALHFSRDELAARRRRACRAMAERGLDGLLIFRQESMYYLTGYDTSGYSMFQGMYLGADGKLALCTRSADLRQARITSVIKDCWKAIAAVASAWVWSTTPTASPPSGDRWWTRRSRVSAAPRTPATSFACSGS